MKYSKPKISKLEAKSSTSELYVKEAIKSQPNVWYKEWSLGVIGVFNFVFLTDSFVKNHICYIGSDCVSEYTDGYVKWTINTSICLQVCFYFLNVYSEFCFICFHCFFLNNYIFQNWHYISRFVLISWWMENANAHMEPEERMAYHSISITASIVRECLILSASYWFGFKTVTLTFIT